MSESMTQVVGLLLFLLFPAWGIAGLVASMWNKRSTLRAWWFGSRYGSVGEPGAGPILAARTEGERHG